VKLNATDFQILLTLAGEPRHGYGIMQEVARQSGGAVKMGPGSLYGAIKRLLDAGLVVEGSPPRSAEEDPRRTSYYRITPAGRKAASEAARELADLVSVAVSHGLLPAAGR
jgi:DNA-binding PadR family transcriptional regulator